MESLINICIKHIVATDYYYNYPLDILPSELIELINKSYTIIPKMNHLYDELYHCAIKNNDIYHIIHLNKYNHRFVQIDDFRNLWTSTINLLLNCNDHILIKELFEIVLWDNILMTRGNIAEKTAIVSYFIDYVGQRIPDYILTELIDNNEVMVLEKHYIKMNDYDLLLSILVRSIIHNKIFIFKHFIEKYGSIELLQCLYLIIQDINVRNSLTYNVKMRYMNYFFTNELNNNQSF